MKALVTGGSGYIGTHLIRHLLSLGYTVVNVDVAPPGPDAPKAEWRKASILDAAELERIFRSERPEGVVHLAAYADVEGKTMDDFRANTDGTANVLSAVKACGSVERLVVTSTQHVRRPGSGLPTRDDDYVPYMLYGESKVITEKLTRGANLPGHWTLIRPTNVWGTHHPNLVTGLWGYIHRGVYVHPAGDQVFRSFAYVKNVVWQIERILALPAAATAGKTLYVADENAQQYDWINGFALALTGKKVKTVPRWMLHGAAIVGDGMRAMGRNFPMHGSRFYNLTTNNPVPIEKTFDILGRGPISMQDGIAETAEWLLRHYRQAK